MLDCVETNFLNFKFENLRENEFVRKTILTCLSGAQMGLIHEKIEVKILVTLPLKGENALGKLLNFFKEQCHEILNHYFFPELNPFFAKLPLKS